MPSSLALYTGLGASVAIAAGSLYFLISTSAEEYRFRKKKPTGIERMINPRDSIIKIYKEVPLLIYEQTNGFSTIQEELGTLVEIQGYCLLDLQSSDGSQPFVPESCNNYYKYVKVEGYRQDVLLVSQAIDRLIEKSGSNQFQVFEVRSSQVKSILGHKNTLIRGIEKESGAKVNIGQFDAHKSMFSTVQICGTDHQIREAYKLIDLHLSKDRRYQNRNVPVQPVDDESFDSDEEFIRNQLKKGENNSNGQKANGKSGRLLPILHNSAQRTKFVTFEALEAFTEKLKLLDPKNDSNDLYSLFIPDKVYVAFTVNPSYFYLQINDTRSFQLDHLHQDMQEFFASKANRELSKYEKKDNFEDYQEMVGDIVAVMRLYSEDQSQSQYYRACVMNVIPPEAEIVDEIVAGPSKSRPSSSRKQVLFDLFYVDYGHSEIKPLEAFYVLSDSFVKQLPFQGVKCRLNDVVPFGEDGQKWSEEAIETFRSLTFEGMWIDVTSMCCRGYDEKSKLYLVDLICLNSEHQQQQNRNQHSQYNQRGRGFNNNNNRRGNQGFKKNGNNQPKTFDLGTELVKRGLAKRRYHVNIVTDIEETVTEETVIVEKLENLEKPQTESPVIVSSNSSSDNESKQA